MKILTYNINGIRAAVKKGFIDWLNAVNAEIVCLQEIKATKEQVDLSMFKNIGYHYIIWNSAQKKGYSGTAILSKIPFTTYTTNFNNKIIDEEGRVIVAQFNDITVVNAYFPSGASKPERQEIKLKFLTDYEKIILNYKNENTVLCGDFNICHQSIDIHDPVKLNGVPGFTMPERKWMDKIIQQHNFTDAFRFFDKSPFNYTWWSYMAKARERNAGWRIDYQLVSSKLLHSVVKCNHLVKANHSDHCPVLLTINR
jgi:exodeoxyribonuclease-3